MSQTIYIDRAGCNRRRLDLARIEAYLTRNGYTVVRRPELAEAVIVATCAFKQKEEDASVLRVARFAEHPGQTLVFGCLPDIAPHRYEGYGHLPVVAPRNLERISDYFPASRQSFEETDESHLLRPATPGESLRSVWQNFDSLRRGSGISLRDFLHQVVIGAQARLRQARPGQKRLYYLMVARGCLGRCSYCAIKKAIGPVRSRPPEVLVEDFAQGLELGFQNFAVLGDDPGCYGLDIGSSLADLLDLLAARLAKDEARPGQTPGKVGFHLKEIHPQSMIALKEHLVAGAGLPLVVSLLCPIQSGSDRILELMQRDHTRAELLETLQALRSRQPDMVLSTQIIVGFPSETDDDFRATLETVREGGFASVVVFPYHDKFGTDSFALPDKIPPPIIRRRVREAFRYLSRNGVQAVYSCPA